VTPSLSNSSGALNKKTQMILHFSCRQFCCQSAETAPDPSAEWLTEKVRL